MKCEHAIQNHLAMLLRFCMAIVLAVVVLGEKEEKGEQGEHEEQGKVRRCCLRTRYPDRYPVKKFTSFTEFFADFAYINLPTMGILMNIK